MEILGARSSQKCTGHAVEVLPSLPLECQFLISCATTFKRRWRKVSQTGYKVNNSPRKYLDHACVLSVNKNGKFTGCAYAAFRRTGEVPLVHSKCQTLQTQARGGGLQACRDALAI